jgi:hypothetical protein
MCVKTQFVTTYFAIVVREVDDKFHQNFQIGLQINPHTYIGMNIICATWSNETLSND